MFLWLRSFRYPSNCFATPRGGTCHERLELFIPLDGPVKFRMGDQTVSLERGDLLVVGNLKIHHVVDFPGFNTRVIVISFQPEFVYSLGSPSGDCTFLLPFHSKLDRRPHVLRAGPEAAAAHSALTGLLQQYFGPEERQFLQAGSTAHLLLLLFHLAREFRSSEILKWEFMRQQQRSLRLKRLFDHLQAHSDERLSVGEAAKRVATSPAAFGLAPGAFRKPGSLPP